MKKDENHFLNEVTDHIRSKEAKKFVKSELEFHLRQVKNKWIEKGLSEQDAEEKAVLEMGNPTKLGLELNKLHRPRIDWLIISLLMIAMGLGFLPVVLLEGSGITVDYFLRNKVVFVILGVIVAMGLMIIDYRKLEKFGWLFYAMGVCILLLISLFPSVIMNGQPLIKIGPFTIESLMAVPFFFLAWASFFSNRKLKAWHLGLLFLFSMYLFLAIPNLSTTFIYMMMVFVMVWWSKQSLKKVLLIAILPASLIVFVGIYFLPIIKEYQVQRVLGFLNPENFADGAGYTYLRLQELMSSATWFGKSGDMEFIPGAHTDFVFAGLTYYYGYFLALILVLVLAFFVVRMLVISHKLPSHYGKMLLVGVTALYAFQLIYNIGMILGLLPITSISLPFVSYGLMPTLFNAFLIGIVLSVYRRKNWVASRFSKS